jgi:hypothetical protein
MESRSYIHDAPGNEEITSKHPERKQLHRGDEVRSRKWDLVVKIYPVLILSFLSLVLQTRPHRFNISDS